jgi:hypothetical protein
MKGAIIPVLILITILGASVINTVCVPAQGTMGRGDGILVQRALFGNDVANVMDLEPLRANLGKRRHRLPEGTQLTTSTIKQEYGRPDSIVIERAPRTNSDLEIEQYRRRSLLPPGTWSEVAVYYYGDVGFGVDRDDPEGAVLFITNRTDNDDAVGEKTLPTKQANIRDAQMAFDGNWDDSRAAVNLFFTIVDNAITNATIVNLRTNICNDGGTISNSYATPIQIDGNSFEITVDGSTGSNFWFTTITGTFSSDTVVSGTEDFLILGQCGLKSGSASFTAQRKPDYVLFTTPSIQNIVAGESTSYSVGVRALGSFSQPVQVEMVVPSVPGVTLNLSSNTIQPGGNAALSVTTTGNTSPVLLGIFLRSSTGGATHGVLAILSLRTFELTVNPAARTVGKGQAATFTLNSRTAQFKDPVTLSSSVSPSSGIAINLASTALIPGQSTTFTATSAGDTRSDTYSITITATAGQVKETANASLRVSDPDFELAISPGSQPVAPGGSSSFNLEVRPLLGFNQAVSLSASVSPNDGNLSAGLTSGSVIPGSATTLTARASASAQQNSSFTITVRGASGALSHTSTATVKISGPDFSLAFDSPTITAEAGTKARATVLINRTGEFTGNVTVTPPAPANGIKAKPADPITTTDAVATFKMKIGGNVAPGSYKQTFTGKDDSGRSRTATVTLNVQ